MATHDTGGRGGRTPAILEIRTYRLKPGTRDAFVDLMRAEAAPLLARFGITVVDCGPSLVDEDGNEEAYLVRAFRSLEERQEQEEAFYGSDDWREGPREAVLAPIESFHTIVMEVTQEAVDALRR
ncbi:MAG TPA: NIPSNAP family protein [Acidimicrobiales bacterium]